MSTEDVYKELQRLMPIEPSVATLIPAGVALLWRRNDVGELEVFLVRRATTMRFLPGFWAFPGGKQDPEDSGPAEAAARELQEETGVRVPVGKLEPAGRWITPKASPLRYDTHYFLAELPAGQSPDVACSDGELIDGLWLRPSDALVRFDRGTLLMSSPVVRMLDALCHGIEQFPDRVAQAMLDEEASPRLWGLVGGVAVSPLRTPTLPPATRTNCYVIGTDEFIVIDPGPPHEDERDVLCEALDARIADGAVFREIWLTHHHADHVGAAEFLAGRYQVPIAAHEITAELLKGKFRVDRHLVDGERCELAGRLPRVLECVFTPGHAPGHLCFYEHETASLIAGDMVASHGTILIDPSEGDMAQYIDSLSRLRSRKARLLLPAHGFAISDPDTILQHYMEHRLMREDRIVAALSTEPQSPAQLVAQVYADTPVVLHGLATRSLLSHLVKLEAEGRAGKLRLGSDELVETPNWVCQGNADR